MNYSELVNEVVSRYLYDSASTPANVSSAGLGTCYWLFVAAVFLFPGNYSAGMRGEMIREAGSVMWVCWPVDLDDRKKMCNLVNGFDRHSDIKNKVMAKI